MDSAELKILIEKAVGAKEYSYSPYSKFRVGAAVLTDSGEIFSGCNIENASYGATVCAERAAIFQAVSKGSRKIRAVAIAADEAGFTPPCGICRQVISEFSADAVIVLVNGKGKYKTFNIKELLPFSFKL